MEQNQQYDILLTYPSENIRLFESMIPLGLASIAAVLEQNKYTVINVLKNEEIFSQKNIQ